MQILRACEFELDKLALELDKVVSSDVGVIDDTVQRIVGLLEDRRCWEDAESRRGRDTK